MRILGAVLLLALVATLGLVACVAPVAESPAPGATPLPSAFMPATNPGATAVAPGATPVPTPFPTPRTGATIVSSDTKTYPLISGTKTETLALKAGDVVVLTVTCVGSNISVDVDQPDGRVALMPQMTGANGTMTVSFKAAMDGDYKLHVWEGRVAATGSDGTVKIDIYR
jgi:hypothetical protein